MTDIAIPDDANYAFGDAPIPDNFLDDTLSKAVSQHRRKESQIASVEEDFAKVLDQNVASNIAANLIGYIHDPNDESNRSNDIARDPDEDDVRVGDDDEQTHDEIEYGLDEMLIETVTAHKHRESRTDFVEAKLHELFPQDEEEDDAQLYMKAQQGGAVNMSVIASNLVSFLHDEPEPSNDNDRTINIDPSQSQSQIENSKKKARISTDLIVLQQEIDRLKSKVNNLEKQLKNTDDKNSELNDRVTQLECKNHGLMKEIQFLQNSKTTLAMNTTQCIDELRSILIQYQKHVTFE